jgi:hypothetical protein
LQALGANAQWSSFEDDDSEPDAVSIALYAKLQLHNLTTLCTTFKVFGINTCHSLGHHRSEEELYEKELYIYFKAQRQPVGTMMRLRALLKDVNDYNKSRLGGHPPRDTAPAPVSKKLWARLMGSGIERLHQVLVACDVLSYEALSMMTDTEFEELFVCARGQGFRWDEAIHLANLRAEARNTRPGFVVSCGPPPPGLEGLETLPRGQIAVRTKFNWERFLMAMLAMRELERALLWSEHHRRNWVLISRLVWQAKNNLTCDTDALRGCVQAAATVEQLTKAARNEGWAHSGCAAALRSARPTLRDVLAWRAVDLVGITDREEYRSTINISSGGEVEKNANYQSQVLMAFESNLGHMPEAFSSNSSKDKRRRGKPRPRRRRGCETEDDGSEDEEEDASDGDVAAGGSTLNAASPSFWPQQQVALPEQPVALWDLEPWWLY